MTVQVIQGVAAFSDLTLDMAAGGYTLQISSAEPADGHHRLLRRRAPAAASQLVVRRAVPPSVTAGTGFGLTVAVEDAYGNIVTDYSGSVTVALSTPAGAALGGTTNGPGQPGRRHVLRTSRSTRPPAATRSRSRSTGLPTIASGSDRGDRRRRPASSSSRRPDLERDRGQASA